MKYETWLIPVVDENKGDDIADLIEWTVDKVREKKERWEPVGVVFSQTSDTYYVLFERPGGR